MAVFEADDETQATRDALRMFQFKRSAASSVRRGRWSDPMMIKVRISQDILTSAVDVIPRLGGHEEYHSFTDTAT